MRIEVWSRVMGDARQCSSLYLITRKPGARPDTRRYSFSLRSVTPMPAPPDDLTAVLRRVPDGGSGGVRRGLTVRLRRTAPPRRDQVRRTPGTTMRATALVHEAYERLVDQTRADYADRVHFFGVAAKAMRHILIDHAR